MISEKQRPAGTSASVTAQIKERALQLGFSKVGVARAEDLTEEYSRLQDWLARGYNGEMKWMERDPLQRTDPRRFFPPARSVIVVALNYYTEHEHEVRTACGPGSPSGQPALGGCGRAKSESLTGKISRYAWGDDYHEVVAGKLRELLSWIKAKWSEADGKVCVDIQPVMDKAWAARAGLGWIGKHTNLITQEFGSWVFIGELLLNLDLEADETVVADQCGSCTLCIDACPTGAIVEPYLLDANRCISHATIESRATEICADVAEHLEGWLYGCDICQDVCPWNQMTSATTEPRFQPRAGNVNASLSEIQQLTPEAYAEHFRGSAMKRAKLSGWQRNARALLNTASADETPRRDSTKH